jgi:hypothetical protein
MPAACSCNICCRQPPILQSMAVRVVVHHVLSVGELFELTQNTTYQEYVYAVRSNLVTERWQLQPPEFPHVEVSFRFDRLPHLLHDHCPGRGGRRLVRLPIPLAAWRRRLPKWCIAKRRSGAVSARRPSSSPDVYNPLSVACNPPPSRQ